MRSPCLQVWLRAAAAGIAAATLGLSASQVQAGRAPSPEVSFPNSGAAAAQAPFRRGLIFLGALEYGRAARAFREAQAADPAFAMAYWGEAMTFTHSVWEELDTDPQAGRAALAKLAPTAVERLRRARTDREKAYLEAVEVLYSNASQEVRELGYVDAMRRLHERYPDDVNAAAFYALALLGLSNQGQAIATKMKAAAILEEMLPRYPRHPGVLLYLMHAYDDRAHAPLGVRAARLYTQLQLDTPHALHMTSHIFIKVGMWDGVVRANADATRATNAVRTHDGHAPSFCGHRQIWLFYGLLQLGRANEADDVLRACRREALAETPTPSAANYDPAQTALASALQMRLLKTTFTGADDPKDDIPVPPQDFPLERFSAAYTGALSHLKTASAGLLKEDLAQLELIKPQALAFIAAAKMDPRWPYPLDPAYAGRIEIMSQQMRGADLVRSGEVDRGLAVIQAAADQEDQFIYEAGVPFVEKPSLELLADEEIRLGRRAAAASAYRKVLERWPQRAPAAEALRRLREPPSP